MQGPVSGPADGLCRPSGGYRARLLGFVRFGRRVQMSISSQRVVEALVLAVAGACALGAASVHAQKAAAVAAKAQHGSVSSGTIGVRWNRELVADLGLRLGAAQRSRDGLSYQQHETFDLRLSRCNGCTGAGGNGQAVFTPSSTLRNNVNNGSTSATIAGDPLGTSAALYAADIPWYSKFSGNFAPYNNDQHPYLIWNLYRLNRDGSIDQIGRSGVKHAFLTLNTNCIENPGDSHILGRGCANVYSVSNNDSNSALGPRSEIVPASNVWGRCGSVYDTNCDGMANATPEGRVKVAVKATNLGSGRWRYDYAVMNVNFTRAQTAGAEPKLRVLSSVGFDSFVVPVGAATISDLVFSDGDLDSQNDGVASVGRSGVSWTAPNAASALNWGTMTRFSFIVGEAPAKATVTLRVGASGDPKALKPAKLLAPGTRRID